MVQEIAAAQVVRTPDRWQGHSALVGKALTSREQQAWLLMVEGCSEAEIAERLSLNSLTVRVHLSNASAKQGAASR